MNRILGNNKLLLRKSKFFGMFLASTTKPKAKFIFTPRCPNVVCFHLLLLLLVHESGLQPTGFPRIVLGASSACAWWAVTGQPRKGPTWGPARPLPGRRWRSPGIALSVEQEGEVVTCNLRAFFSRWPALLSPPLWGSGSASNGRAHWGKAKPAGGSRSSPRGNGPPADSVAIF